MAIEGVMEKGFVTTTLDTGQQRDAPNGSEATPRRPCFRNTAEMPRIVMPAITAQRSGFGRTAACFTPGHR